MQLGRINARSGSFGTPGSAQGGTPIQFGNHTLRSPGAGNIAALSLSVGKQAEHVLNPGSATPNQRLDDLRNRLPE